MRLRHRLGRLERRVPPPGAVRSPVDLDATCRKLEAVGLVHWDAAKRYWSPTDPILLKQLLVERRARCGAGERR